MKLAEVKMVDVGKSRKIADAATKVVISGIDKIVGTKSPAAEYQYYTVIKNFIDKRFEQIIRKRMDRGNKAAQQKR